VHFYAATSLGLGDERAGEGGFPLLFSCQAVRRLSTSNPAAKRALLIEADKRLKKEGPGPGWPWPAGATRCGACDFV